MVQILILAKIVRDSWKIIDKICEKYKLLYRNDTNQIKGVSVCYLCICCFANLYHIASNYLHVHFLDNLNRD